MLLKASLAVYEKSSAKLTSEGCGEDSSIGWGLPGKKSDKRRGSRKLADARGGRIERI